MKTYFYLAVILLLSCPGSPAEDYSLKREEVEGTLQSAKLNEIFQQYLAMLQSLDPEDATRIGIHETDQLLTVREVETLNKKLQSLRDFRKRLQEIAPDELDIPTKIDLETFDTKLEVDIFNIERMDYLRKRPQYYLAAMDSIYGILDKEFAPYNTRAANALERLRQFPATLLLAEKNLFHPPKIWVEQAIQQSDDMIRSLPEIVPMFRRYSRYDPTVRALVETAVSNAREALKRYNNFLQSDILPQADGDFVIGTDAYGFYLERWHHLSYTPKAMHRRAKRIFNKTLSDLRAEVAVVDPDAAKKGADWPAVIEKMSKDHPKEEELLKVFREETERAYGHFDKYKVVPLPMERIRVRETPGFLRSVRPFAYYNPPFPLDEARVAEFFVSLPDKTLSDKTRELILQRNFNYPQIEMIIAHEVMPGRHLQSALSATSSQLRRIASSPLTQNGWAGYSEYLAYEMGFYTSHSAKLFYLRWKLLMAARALLDVELHMGLITYDEALRFLQEEVYLPASQAKSEILRISLNPTEGMSYVIGMEEILRIRKKYESSEDRQFRLRDFHAKFLQLGNLPLPLIEQELRRLEQESESAEVAQ